jgi:23S rRNA (uracil1939-C5)-methyltransferase
VGVVCRDLDEEGAGVGSLRGCRIHVAGALPGEAVSATIEHISPHLPAEIQGEKATAEAWARLTSVDVASPARVAPVCPAHGSCGGCPLQHLAYPAQVSWKGERVRRLLATQQGAPVAPCVPSPRPLGYRNQGKYVWGRSPDGRLVLGAYAPRTHAIVDLAGCRVVEPPIDGVAAVLRERLEAHAVEPYHEQQRQGTLRYAVLRANAAGEVLVTLVAARRDWGAARQIADELCAGAPAVAGVVLNVNDAPGNVLLGPEETPLAGHAAIVDEIAGARVEVSSRSFFQVNREVAARAYQDLREAASRLGPMARVADAYAGAGGIAFALASLAREVVAIEQNAAATRAAASAARASGLERIRFVTGDVARHLAGVGDADLVVLNPPRSGCAPEVLATTARLRPRMVAYLSCNPVSLARDLGLLHERGYVTSEVRPYDMLPHTPHVEALAFLAPSSAC